MFGIGTWELVVILLLALIVLGPQKLPEVAKTIGKTLVQWRRSLEDVKREIDLDGIKEEIGQDLELDELRSTLDIRADVRKALDELERESRPGEAEASDGSVIAGPTGDATGEPGAKLPEKAAEAAEQQPAGHGTEDQ